MPRNRRFFPVRLIGVMLALIPVAVITRSAEAAPPSGTSLNGLVAYWSFDDSTNFNVPDVGGSTLTKGNGASWSASGKFGGALSLNGSSQSLYDTSSPSYLPIGNTPYSQSVWFKPSAVTGAGGLVGWGNYGSTRQTRALRMYEGSGGFRHYWWGNDLDCTGSQCPLTAGNWYHVVATYDGTSRKLYLNGVEVRSDTPGVGNATAANFHIGKTCCSEYFTGLIDDVAIYDRALTVAEISDLSVPTTTTSTTTTTTTTTTTSTTTTTTTTIAPSTTAAPIANAPTTTQEPAIQIVINAPTTTAFVPSTVATTATSPAVVAATIPAHSTQSTVLSSPATTSATTTTTAPSSSSTTTTSPVAPVVGVVQTGEASVSVDGQDETPTIQRLNNQVIISVGEMSATVSAVDQSGSPTQLDNDGNVVLKDGDKIAIKVNGFAPDSTVEAWLFSTPTFLGSAKVDASGSLSTVLSIPANVPAGSHRIAIEATTADGKDSTFTLGVLIGNMERSNVTTWLIVIPVVLAVLGALLLPAVLRRRGDANQLA